MIFDLGHDIKLECFGKKKNGTPDIHLNDTGADLLARRILTHTSVLPRDVSAGATGATAVAPKFSDTLTLTQPWGADFAHHRRGRT